ncbi:MAG: L,D-transpeptidase family protein, partial [Syntrophorhabdus sp.]
LAGQRKLKRLIAPLTLIWLVCLIFPAFLSGATEEDKEITATGAGNFLKAVEERFPVSSQVIVVSGNEASGLDARLIAFQKNENQWKRTLGPIQATLGRDGFAPSGEKREGDGRTPRGVYPLGFVFGYGQKIDSAMPYRQMTRNDIWVDDPNSPDYNRLKKKGQTRAKSFEDMVLSDDRYKYGIVVEYNTDPVIPGHGSAIFVHIWKDSKTSTSGCIAISEENILKLLRWLDPAKKPVIVLEPLTSDP